ncbi:MAG TPA: phage integrase N-terminal SAM-like domain-containing protein, partial [Gemmatimonadaceae bacterium]|nr:phage integrase N-terminal SAM-like domain-containing protein [Gemmatimonadaceae bacterium]
MAALRESLWIVGARENVAWRKKKMTRDVGWWPRLFAVIIAKPKLLDRVRGRMRARHMSPRTERAYVGWIIRYIRYHGTRHPAELGEAEIVAFLTYLAADRRVSRSTQMQALSGLLLLYRDVLDRPVGDLRAVLRSTSPTRLPVVLSRAEVRAVLAALSGPTRLVALLLYGAGLRLMECLTLRLKDTDFARGEITVRRGKGGKDRVTMLPGVAGCSNYRWSACAPCMRAISAMAPGGWCCQRHWIGRRRAGRRSRRGSGCSRRRGGTGIRLRGRSAGIACTRRR